MCVVLILSDQKPRDTGNREDRELLFSQWYFIYPQVTTDGRWMRKQ